MGTGETLSFEAFRNNSGEYWCLADNGLNSTDNASAFLDVQCKYENNMYCRLSLNVDNTSFRAVFN